LFNKRRYGWTVPTAGNASIMTASAALAKNPDLTESLAARALRAGTEHLAAGRIDQAVAAFRRGFAEAENQNLGQSGAAIVAELHFKLGNAGMIRGDLDMAAESYSAALRLEPDMTHGWCNLGNVYLKWDRA
jgi:tetratricopeptide (TPR) repeat protein